MGGWSSSSATAASPPSRRSCAATAARCSATRERSSPASAPRTVTQDAFSKAFVALRGSDKEIKLRPWLYRIVRNTALNELRDSPPQTAELDERAVGGEEPADTLERRQRVEALMAGLAELPEPQRAAIVMRELEGLSTEQIAKSLGLSGGAVRQSIYRARTTLRNGAGMLVPLPLLRFLATGLGPDAATGAAAGGAGIGLGMAAKAAVATLLVAGTGAAGVAIQQHRQAQAQAQASGARPAAGGQSDDSSAGDSISFAGDASHGNRGPDSGESHSGPGRGGSGDNSGKGSSSSGEGPGGSGSSGSGRDGSGHDGSGRAGSGSGSSGPGSGSGSDSSGKGSGALGSGGSDDLLPHD